MKHYAFFLILLLIFSGLVVSVQAQTYVGLKRVTVGERSGAWLEDWAYRREITINSSKVDSDLTDFATLIYLSASSGETDANVTSIFDEVGSDSNALAFTSSDATTRLYYEVEYWNSTSKEAYVWVKVPSIANSPDTKIYIYYDSTKDGSAYKVAEQVWESSAVMVQHLEESSGTLYDSTSNNNDGTNYGATYSVSGQIDNALSFDGINDYVETIPTSWSGQFSVIIWFKATTIPQAEYKSFFSSASSAASGSFQIDFGGAASGFPDNFRTLLKDGTSTVVIDLGSQTTNWVMVSIVCDSSKWQTYRDTSLIGTRDTTQLGYFDRYRIGVNRGLNQYVAATIDEVRIYNQTKSLGWIKANYYSGIDSLVNYGSEEGTLLYPENIVVSKLTENYDVYLYNATALVCNATVASSGNATLTLPSEYREDTFEGTFKIYDENDNHILTQVFDDTRGGDEYEALQETTNIWILGYMFGATGFVLGVFALLYMRNKKEKEEGEELYIEEEEYYTEEESWQ